MLVKYVKNEHRFSFNEDGTINEGIINGKVLTDEDKAVIEEYTKLMKDKFESVNAEISEINTQKQELSQKAEELAKKFNDETIVMREELQEKIFNKYVADSSTKEVQEWKPDNIFWWIQRWI